MIINPSASNPSNTEHAIVTLPPIISRPIVTASLMTPAHSLAIVIMDIDHAQNLYAQIIGISAPIAPPVTVIMNLITSFI